MGCMAIYLRRAWTGHSGVLLAARRTVTPCRKGSVLEALMFMFAMSFSMLTSSNRRVVEGSNFDLWVEVYSETQRKPKKAEIMAAQIISLSS